MKNSFLALGYFCIATFACWGMASAESPLAVSQDLEASDLALLTASIERFNELDAELKEVLAIEKAQIGVTIPRPTYYSDRIYVEGRLSLPKQVLKFMTSPSPSQKARTLMLKRSRELHRIAALGLVLHDHLNPPPH